MRRQDIRPDETYHVIKTRHGNIMIEPEKRNKVFVKDIYLDLHKANKVRLRKYSLYGSMAEMTGNELLSQIPDRKMA